jgi:hypothetical protein
MTHPIETNRTELFSVVGGPFVRENHHERVTRDHQNSEMLRGGGVASLWLVFYTVVIGISMFAHSGGVKLANTAAAVVR